jgi:hypothetical protein
MTIYGKFEIPLPWDVLNAATIENLPGYAPGFVEFAPPQILTPGLSVFTLKQNDLGELGKLTLRISGSKMTLVYVSDPPHPSEDEIDPDYLDKLKNALKVSRKKFFLVKEELQEQINQLYDRRKEHLQKVICAYSSRLVHDLSIWQGNRVIPPPYLLAWAGLNEWPDKNTMSTEGQEYYERFKLEILVESNPDLSFIQQNAIAKVTPESQEINLQDITTEGFIAWLQDYCQHTSGFISTNKGQYVLQGVHILRDGSKQMVEIIFDWIATSGMVYKNAGTIQLETHQVDTTLEIHFPVIMAEISRGYIDQLHKAIAYKWPNASKISHERLTKNKHDKQPTVSKGHPLKKVIQFALILLSMVFLAALLVMLDTFFGIVQDVFKHNFGPLIEPWISSHTVLAVVLLLVLGVVIAIVAIYRDRFVDLLLGNSFKAS